MNASILVLPAVLDHIEQFVPLAREADVAELAAASGWAPRQALEHGVLVSTVAWTAWIDIEPLCMLGVSPVNAVAGVGAPWCIGTPALERSQFAFLRQNREYVARMLDAFPHLVNYVDERHVVAKRWLRWLGFHLGPPERFGVAGLPFRRFELHSNAAVYRMRAHV